MRKGPDGNTRGGQRVEQGPEENGGEREARPTAKDPNRQVNTLLTLWREARKPNGIRFGDLVGGLRRPPAATTASARSYPPSILPHDLYILTSYSRRRHRHRHRHQHEEAS